MSEQVLRDIANKQVMSISDLIQKYSYEAAYNKVKELSDTLLKLLEEEMYKGNNNY